MVVESLPRNFAVDGILRGRCWAVTVGVVIRCSVGAVNVGLVGIVFAQMLFNCIAIKAIDQLGSGFGGNLGRRDPAGECFKPSVENSLHRVGILQ